mmetsp:Transcript_49115/g.158636  ORF Transcript_49115/g.158636 Transcript_49115/m.158636 type:complete len:200 (+) Transcript_49115:2899-3498(+)
MRRMRGIRIFPGGGNFLRSCARALWLVLLCSQRESRQTGQEYFAFDLVEQPAMDSFPADWCAHNNRSGLAGATSEHDALGIGPELQLRYLVSRLPSQINTSDTIWFSGISRSRALRDAGNYSLLGYVAVLSGRDPFTHVDVVRQHRGHLHVLHGANHRKFGFAFSMQRPSKWQVDCTSVPKCCMLDRGCGLDALPAVRD